MKTIGYIRVSTERQASEGVSLDAQRAKLDAWATYRHVPSDSWEIVADEGESAGSIDRPGLQSILERVRRGEVAVVVVAKLDRLTRSIRDLPLLLETFEKHDTGLVALDQNLDTKSASGRLVLNVMMSVLQWEREIIGERTSAAIRHIIKDKKRAWGSAPFGFVKDDDGKLVENPAEQPVLRDISAMRERGTSYEAIAAELDRRGVPTRRGGSWCQQSVRCLLRAAS